MNVTVYLGSSFGNRKTYRSHVAQLGKIIGGLGHNLVYGGSREGLMGLLADAALEAGGRVTGVEPRFFLDQAVQHEGIHELIAVETMAERRVRMMELGDVFIAFPGGAGTLDEASEVICMLKLGKISGSIIFYNLDGYYDPMKMMLDNMVKEGFMFESDLENILFFNDMRQVRKFLENKKEF